MMSSVAAAPLWRFPDGEILSLEAALDPAPFAGYLAFRFDRRCAGFRLLFEEGAHYRATGAVLNSSASNTHVWLEFEGLQAAICLADQAHVVHAALRASKSCSIVSRAHGCEDREYIIPVRRELVKRSRRRRVLEVSNGSRHKNVQRQDGEWTGIAH